MSFNLCLDSLAFHLECLRFTWRCLVPEDSEEEEELNGDEDPSEELGDDGGELELSPSSPPGSSLSDSSGLLVAIRNQPPPGFSNASRRKREGPGAANAGTELPSFLSESFPLAAL